MPLYLHSAPSPIDRLTVIKTEKGSYRAYIHTRAGVSPAVNAQIRSAIQAKGWYAIPVTYGGDHALEIRTFPKEKALVDLLTQGGWLQGQPQQLPAPGDTKTTEDMIRERSLQLAGVSFAIGDAGFFGYGLKNASPLDAAAGIAYAGGTWSLLGYGRNDRSDMQVRDLSRRFVTWMQENQHKIPADCAMTRIAEDQKKGLIGSVDEIFARYPSEMFGLFTGIAGSLIAAAALRRHIPEAKAAGSIKKQISGWLDFGLGTTTMAASWIPPFIVEKHPDPDQPPPATTYDKIKQWVQEKPLRLTGYGLMISTLCHAVSTTIDWRETKRMGDVKGMQAIYMRAVFVVTNLFAEILIALSSKGHGEGVEADASVEKSVIALTAELIAKEKPQMHELLITQATRFLGAPEVLGSKDRDIEGQLREQLAQIRKSPWAAQELHTAPAVALPRKTIAGPPQWQRLAPVPPLQQTATP